jgi:hypothetical protein
MSLKEYFAHFPGKPVILRLADQDPAKSDGLAEILENNNMTDKIILHSPYNSNLLTLRKTLPRAVYSINRQTMLQTSIYASFFIETMAPLKGDVVISTANKQYSNGVFKPRILMELKRRQIPILLQVNSSASEALIKKIEPLGLIYN